MTDEPDISVLTEPRIEVLEGIHQRKKTGEIAEYQDASVNTVANRLRRLKEEGFIERAGNYWDVTEAGEIALDFIEEIHSTVKNEQTDN